MQTALPPQSLTDAERVNEAAHILATGIIRWRRQRQGGSLNEKRFLEDSRKSGALNRRDLPQ
ncbi:MAG: hypothetical protein ACI9HY_000591 [Planctomycetaceae bacterium]|jgi:hypothetical protein